MSLLLLVKSYSLSKKVGVTEEKEAKKNGTIQVFQVKSSYKES